MRCQVILLWIKTLALSLMLIACRTEKEPPYPSPMLDERNKRIAEVKEAINALELGDEGIALQSLDHVDHRVRRQAARKLGSMHITSEETIARLARGLDDEDRDVRIATADALAHAGTDEALDYLVKALVDEDHKVRVWAYKGLVRIKERAVPLLVKHLGHDSPYRSLVYTDATKQRHGTVESLLECLAGIGKPSVSALREALSNEHLDVRMHIVKALGDIGADASESIQELLDIANSEEDLELRKSALNAIGNIGDMDPEVTPTLMGLTHSSNAAIAQSARKTLKTLEDNAKKGKKP